MNLKDGEMHDEMQFVMRQEHHCIVHSNRACVVVAYCMTPSDSKCEESITVTTFTTQI